MKLNCSCTTYYHKLAVQTQIFYKYVYEPVLVYTLQLGTKKLQGKSEAGIKQLYMCDQMFDICIAIIIKPKIIEHAQEYYYFENSVYSNLIKNANKS